MSTDVFLNFHSIIFFVSIPCYFLGCEFLIVDLILDHALGEEPKQELTLSSALLVSQEHVAVVCSAFIHQPPLCKP